MRWLICCLWLPLFILSSSGQSTKELNPFLCANLKRYIAIFNEVFANYDYPKKPLFYFAFQKPVRSIAFYEALNFVVSKFNLLNQKISESWFSDFERSFGQFGFEQCPIKTLEFAQFVFKVYTLGFWNFPRDLLLRVLQAISREKLKAFVMVFSIYTLDCDDSMNEEIINLYEARKDGIMDLLLELFDLFDHLLVIRSKRHPASKSMYFFQFANMGLMVKEKLFLKLVYAKLFAEIKAYREFDLLSSAGQEYIKLAFAFLKENKEALGASPFYTDLYEYYQQYYNFSLERNRGNFSIGKIHNCKQSTRFVLSSMKTFKFPSFRNNYDIFNLKNDDLKIFEEEILNMDQLRLDLVTVE